MKAMKPNQPKARGAAENCPHVTGPVRRNFFGFVFRLPSESPACFSSSPGLCHLLCPSVEASWRPHCPRVPSSRPSAPATPPSPPSTPRLSPDRRRLHHANADLSRNPRSAMATADSRRTSPFHSPLSRVCELGVGTWPGRICLRTSVSCPEPSFGRFGETCPPSSTSPRSVYIWNGCGLSRPFRTLSREFPSGWTLSQWP